MRAVDYSYPDGQGANGSLPVLRDISFELAPGELLAITGPSGCGKTTLLRLIAAFIPPQHGEILIDGTPLRRPGVGCVFIPQEQSLFPWKTVLDNAAFGLKARGLPRRERVSLAIRYLELVKLAEFAHKYPGQLSSGMRQRLALARALAVGPKLILMDEPFASLDWQSRRSMQDEFLRVCELTRQTVVLVTHDVEEAIYLADRVMVLTPRPSTIAETIHVPLPRPRVAEQRFAAASLELQQRVCDRLGAESV